MMTDHDDHESTEAAEHEAAYRRGILIGAFAIGIIPAIAIHLHIGLQLLRFFTTAIFP